MSKIPKNDLKQKHLKIFLLTGSFFIFGLVVGILFDKLFFNVKEISSNFYNVRLSDPKYKMISPVLLSGLSIQGDTQEFKTIENTLKLQTYDALNLPGMENISIYFRNLKNGLWAGIGENIGYDPASLLKVPIMITWLKKEQDHPGTLAKWLIWTGSPDDNKREEFYTLHPGQSYTVENLITLMIEKSDNDAKDLLLSNLDAQTLNTVFSDLNIKTWGDTAGTSKQISASMYSRFLRILYNSSYLNRDASEKALELLSSTNFNTGLVAGVPSNIPVAHKFGQYTDSDPTSPIELHDCGIIYYPKSPYLLCIMTRGKTSIETLESIIKTVSETVYNTVSKEN